LEGIKVATQPPGLLKEGQHTLYCCEAVLPLGSTAEFNHTVAHNILLAISFLMLARTLFLPSFNRNA
jgi:hypothetical protein